LVANFIRFPAVQNFENRLRLDKVAESLKVGTFFETQCRCCIRFITSQGVRACVRLDWPLDVVDSSTQMSNVVMICDRSVLVFMLGNLVC